MPLPLKRRVYTLPPCHFLLYAMLWPRCRHIIFRFYDAALLHARYFLPRLPPMFRDAAYAAIRYHADA